MSRCRNVSLKAARSGFTRRATRNSGCRVSGRRPCSHTINPAPKTTRKPKIQRQGAITRQLAAWAAILAVPTAIAGIYGMNFAHMPELAWRWGYLGLLGIMALTGIGLWVYFARRGFIGTVPDARIENGAGGVVWNMGAFAFEDPEHGVRVLLGRILRLTGRPDLGRPDALDRGGTGRTHQLSHRGALSPRRRGLRGDDSGRQDRECPVHVPPPSVCRYGSR